jgi:hypothetical protein
MLAERSPVDLTVILRQLRMPATRELKSALELEHRLAIRGLTQADAAGDAAWSIDALFEPVGDRELVLAPRPTSLVALE